MHSSMRGPCVCPNHRGEAIQNHSYLKWPSAIMDEQLYSSVLKFMLRDHVEDAKRLNRTLSKSNDAGLVHEMPPIPFTGNLELMERGNCVCLLGINPLWPASGKMAHELELKPAMRLIQRLRDGDHTAFGQYLATRLSYFSSEIANWGHFDKVGSGYSEHFFEGVDKRTVWKNHAFAMDVVPYFSRDATSLDRKRIVEQVSTDPSLNHHQDILASIIAETQPLILHLNGSHAIQVVENLYCERPLERQGALGSQFGLRFGEAIINGTAIKVFAHNQFGYGRYNPSKKHWPEFAKAWKNWRI